MDRWRLRRREVVRYLAGGVALSVLAACQRMGEQGPGGMGSTSSGTPVAGGGAGMGAAPTMAPGAPTMAPDAAANPLVKPRASGAELTAVQASSELAVGRNRFTVGLLDARNQSITTGPVRLEFFKLLQGGTAQKRSDTEAVFRTVGGGSRGVWVSNVDFNEIGSWGAQVTLGDPNAQPKTARLSFEVMQKFSAPGYGDKAPRSKSLTERDAGGDLSRICSNTPPCELHRVSVADALDAGQKPLVVVFATPALCTSALCAPELDAVLQLHTRYADQVNFVHVEIYEAPFDGQRVAKAVQEWSLPSEPWTFVVDKGGTVRERFEGPAPSEELEPALQALLT
jgi:hypothetical protein